MSDVIKRTMNVSANDIKLTTQIEAPANVAIGPIVEKAKEFHNWAMAPDQMKLDLSTENQVIIDAAVLHVDKPKKASKNVSFGINADSLAFEHQSTLFNLHQTGKKVKIIIVELPTKQAKDGVHSTVEIPGQEPVELLC